MLFDTVEFLSPQSTIVNPVVQGEMKQVEVVAPTSPESTISKQYVDDIATTLTTSINAKAATNAPQTFTSPQTFDGGLIVSDEIVESLSNGTGGAAFTVALTSGTLIDLLLNSANCILTFPSPKAGSQFTLFITQDATGGRTVSWPATVVWADSTAPTLTSAGNKTDVVSFLADGFKWLGFVGGKNFAR